ncbi:MAG: peptide chain release factor N(5)-glutamine methyltransferase [Chloroflexota bacterium]|nr:peptide chain release factor N(5)-glutamine methyltransferase [Chloroflexota bacterium]
MAQLETNAGAPTAASLLIAASERLRRSGSPSPRLDAELLISHAFSRDRAWLHAHPDAELSSEAATALAVWLRRREAGEPIAYIRGFKEWFSLRVQVDARALIPRPETELLVESAIAEIASRLTRDGAPILVWDVATGSGAVALALALRFSSALALGRLRLVASDLSPDALELAAENLAAHGVAELATLVCADLLSAAGAAPTLPDLVVANLPYVPAAEVDAAVGSLRYEPRTALDGGPDGLDLVRALLAQLPERLSPHGVALLEMGSGQAPAVRRFIDGLTMRAAVTTLPDLAGIDRVARIARL